MAQQVQRLSLRAKNLVTRMLAMEKHLERIAIRFRGALGLLAIHNAENLNVLST